MVRYVMGRPRQYATAAERQRAYRERNRERLREQRRERHVCHVESILPKRLDDDLWRYADGDQDVYEAFVRALLAIDPKWQAILRRTGTQD